MRLRLDEIRHEDAGKVAAALDALGYELGRNGIRDTTRVLLAGVLGRAPTGDELALELTAAAGRYLAEAGHRGPLRTVEDVRGAIAARLRRRLELRRDLTDEDVDREVERVAAAFLLRTIEAVQARAWEASR